MSLLTVSKLADEVGTSADTLRYYERIGLIPEPARSTSGYRLYGTDAAERVRFIKAAQRVGLRLEEIGELLAIREQGVCPCGRTRHLLEARLSRLDDEMHALARLRTDIQHILDEDLADVEDSSWQCGADLIQITDKPGTDVRATKTTSTGGRK